jgi:hypothetical protein
MQKIYPILFSEAAKTSQDALDADLGLVVFKIKNDLTCVLLSVDRCQQAIETVRRTRGEPTSVRGGRVDARPRVLPADNALTRAIATRAVVGTIGAVNFGPAGRRGGPTPPWNVTGSGVVQKYGPLAYEIAMGAIYPEYLCSDMSLTADSYGIWNKMYQRSDVERKWLGDWGGQALYTPIDLMQQKTNMSKGIPRESQKSIDAFFKRIDQGEKPPPEELFNKMFVQHLPAAAKEMLGPFYAYRLAPSKTNLVNYTQLLKNGTEVIEEMAGGLNLSVGRVRKVIEDAAQKHFERLYYRK